MSRENSGELSAAPARFSIWASVFSFETVSWCPAHRVGMRRDIAWPDLIIQPGE
jgi:hypothetical protein